MQVVNNRKDATMHHHKLNQRHVPTLELLEVLSVEDLLERDHDNGDLGIIQSVSWKLVLMLKTFAVLQKCIWQWKKINQNWDTDANWTGKQGKDQLDNVLALVVLSLVVHRDEDAVDNDLEVQNGCNWDNKCTSNDAIH